MIGFIESLLGLDTMTDQVIAMDLLNSAKSGVKMYAFAVTEASTPAVRDALTRQLHDAIAAHEAIFAYAMEKGLYHPYDLPAQLAVDQTNADTAINLPG